MRGLKILAAVFLLIEEAFWALVHPLRAALERLRIAQRLRALPPGPALVALLVPGFPGAALSAGKYWALAQGRVGLAVALLVAGKLVGLTLFSFVWRQVRPAVLTLRWVRAVHDPIVAILAAAHGWLDRQPWVIVARAWLARLRASLRAAVARLRARVGGWLKRRHHRA